MTEFKHWIIDDYIGIDAVRQINREWPASLRYQDKQNSKKHHCSELSGKAKEIADHFLSKAFTSYLKGLTGISVVPDKKLSGGGLHEIKRGGFLNRHVDFNLLKTPEGTRIRKINALLYLNEDWEDEWNGHLMLYNDNLEPFKKISPIAGRLVIFETSDKSWHGHPEPLNCPVDRSRRSMAFYYYSDEIVKAEKRTTIYR